MFPDGSKEVYDLPNNPSKPTALYMTRAYDPQGNPLAFAYDDRLRLVSVTDAIGQKTTLFYELAQDDLKITRVRDPFGREAKLAYNAAGQLIGITDRVGITSSFTYAEGGDSVRTLTTPYGTTTFDVSGKNAQGNAEDTYTPSDRNVVVTDPMGNRERILVSDLQNGPKVESPNLPPRLSSWEGRRSTSMRSTPGCSSATATTGPSRPWPWRPGT